MDFSPSEVVSFYRQRVPALSLTNSRQWRGKCPVHGGSDDNFAVEAETGMAFCHSQCGRGFDIIALEMEFTGVDFIKAKAEVLQIIGRPKDDFLSRDIEATYNYTDANGLVLYQVVRKFGKKFMQRRPKASQPGEWDWGLGKIEPVPFQLPLVRDAEYVAIVEGEKDAINLTRAGWVATCNSGGAGNFKEALVPYFLGKRVAIFPDNDEVGRKHAEAVAGLLEPVAANVRIVEMPDLPLKGDVSDFLSRGKTKKDLYDLYREAPDWNPEYEFSSEIPHENDKYLRTFCQSVEEAGGHEAFWSSLEIEGIPTPFPTLTQKLGGMRAGEVYVLGANQGAGKTSLALQFAMPALEQHSGVLVFSMEMGHRDVFQRIAAIDARVDLASYRRLKRYGGGPIFDEYDYALRESTKKFSKSPLYVTTKSGVTPEFLVEEALRVKQRAPIKLVIVDHMQLMSTTGRQKSDYEKFTAISRATKGIASELGVPLLLVSQTSRVNSHDRRSELEVSDLRGSGAIEEDAAVVMLLYYDRADFEDAKHDPTGERMKRGPIKTWLKLAKNRYGISGTYEILSHMKSFTRFDLADQGGRE